MTKEFEAMLSWGGSPTATCQCGRKHYVATGENMDDGELAALEANRKAKPDLYIPDNASSSISVGDFNGVSHVFDCPCGSLDRLEGVFWNHRNAVIRYFHARTERELHDAQANAALLTKLSP
jgi:hypothetical protein